MAYVRRYRTKTTRVGPVARPEVTWYMRLAIPDWEIYVQILRHVRAGVPEETLEDAVVVARVFGVEETLRPRAEKVEEFLGKAK